MNVIYIVSVAFAWVLSVVATAIALAAVRKSPRAILKRLETVEEWASDLEMRHESLHASHKKLNSRIAMRIARESKNGSGAPQEVDSGSLLQRPGETDADWKARMRRKIISGELKHAPD